MAVETAYGTVKMKVAWRGGKVVNAAPEFDDCQRLASEKSVPLKQVHRRRRSRLFAAK